MFYVSCVSMKIDFSIFLIDHGICVEYVPRVISETVLESCPEYFYSVGAF